MEKIGIFGEFFYSGNEYAIRHFAEADYCDDEIMHFEHKNSLRAYLSHKMSIFAFSYIESIGFTRPTPIVWAPGWRNKVP
jgi:hypothetical protein